jgi:hypothetical protein
MRKLMSRPRFLLAIMILPLVFAAAASARSLEHGVEEVNTTFFAPLFSQACGFPLYRTSVGTLRFTDFLDDNGLVVKSINHFNITVTITNPANGKTLSTHQSTVVEFIGQDLFGPNEVVYSVTEIGDIFNFTVPGLGTILQGVGRFTRAGRGGDIVFEAGPHDLLDGTADAFCAYMADPKNPTQMRGGRRLTAALILHTERPK